MLDVFIIDRIRQQREESRGTSRAPLHIEIPAPPRPPEQRPKPADEEQERGIAVIDFTI